MSEPPAMPLLRQFGISHMLDCGRKMRKSAAV
jgi:hypothetical protein